MIITLRSIRQKTQHRLSHFPKAYALIAGIGIVLFWRGVWHTVDYLHVSYQGFASTDANTIPWWDGPMSFIVGCTILYFTGAFVSSFIGNELILSGLRGEKKLTQKTESEVKNEVGAIAEIQDELEIISRKLAELEKQSHQHRS